MLLCMKEEGELPVVFLPACILFTGVGLSNSVSLLFECCLSIRPLLGDSLQESTDTCVTGAVSDSLSDAPSEQETG